MIDVRRSLWHEPRPDHVPPVARLDWLLAGGFAAAAVVEGVVRPDLAWRPLVTVIALALVPALLRRRDHPLAATLAGWGAAGLLSVLQLAASSEDLGLASMMVVLVLLYSLVRWGSGREMAGGTAFVAVVVVLGMYASSAGPAEVFGGSVLLLLVVALAVVFRSRADLWQRQRREIRNEERVALARELHDTVAHHVSAIAVQAQAGGVVAGVQPEKAAEVLAAIESEASRTLAEMRSMVRVLREEEPVAYAPQPGVADLPALAHRDTTPTVEVSLQGALTRLARPVDAALYRLAQESLTNARRHARSVTRVGIDVRRDGGTVRLRVSDDGQTDPGAAAEPGFGLMGMAERAQLLGGSLSAGPGPRRWLGGRGRAAGGAAGMSIRVVVADDQELVRTGLVMILGAQPDLEVVGEAADGLAALDLATRLRPDVLLVDIRMPGLDGIEVTRRLAGPDVADPMAVVVITTFDLDEYVLGALRAGARGFLLKDAGPQLLVQAVHAAADGDALIAPNVTRRLLATFADQAPAVPSQPVEPLTGREEQVLALVARGRTNAEIAAELYVGLSTVKSHVASLMTKLGVRNRVEIAMWAHDTRRVRADRS